MLGFHILDLEAIRTEAQKVTGAQWMIVVEMLYNPVVALTKISILLFYKRNTPSEFYQHVIHGTAAFIALHCTAIFFANIFQCTPVSFLWEKYLVVGGHCIDIGAVWLTSGIINIVTDFLIMLMPQPVLWCLHLSLQKRLTLMGIFGLYSM